jgi:hypothetical protein
MLQEIPVNGKIHPIQDTKNPSPIPLHHLKKEKPSQVKFTVYIQKSKIYKVSRFYIFDFLRKNGTPGRMIGRQVNR